MALICALAAATALADNQPAPAKTSHRIRFGGVFVGAGYSRFWGGDPYFGYYPGLWYADPLLLPPIYAPGYFTGFAYGPNLGAVRLQGADKDAWVYLDGALAGRADKLKQMWLAPGVYNLELREGNRWLAQKIYVLSGKTLKVTPDLMEVQP
jgi:hypothetical protein